MTKIKVDTELPDLGSAPERPAAVEPDLNLGITESQKTWLESIVGQSWSVAVTVNSWTPSSESENDAVLSVETEDGTKFTMTIRPVDTIENRQERQTRVEAAEAETATLVSAWEADLAAWNELRDQHTERQRLRDLEAEEASKEE